MCALDIGFRLVMKCKCLFVWLVGLIQKNVKGLGKICRTEKHLIHWEMELRRGYDKIINGYGI